MTTVAERNWQYKTRLEQCPECEEDPPLSEDAGRREPPPTLFLMAREEGGGWQLFEIVRDSKYRKHRKAALLGPRHEGLPVVALSDSGGEHPARITSKLVGLSWTGDRIPFPPRPERTYARRDWAAKYEPHVDAEQDSWTFRCRRCGYRVTLLRYQLDAWARG